MIPLLEYGNGWIIHVDFSAIEHLIDSNYLSKCWAELCKCNDLIGSNNNFIFRMRTRPPEKIYPGYYSRVQILDQAIWMVNANGTTPRNAFVWNNSENSPYRESPTCYVKAAVGTLDPVTVAHSIIHELFHLMMPVGQNDHNTSVGWIFNYNMSPVIGIPMIETVITVARLAYNSIINLAKGYRFINNRYCIIPDLVSSDMPRPGPFPDIKPDYAPPTTGDIVFR